MKLIPLAALGALSLLGASCGGGDSTAPVVTDVSGTLSFAHDGGGGPYSATGSLSATASAATMHATQWAVGATFTGENATFVMASIPRAAGLADVVVLTIDRKTTGVAAIATCNLASATPCTSFMLVIGVPANDGMPVTQCMLESGTVTIAAISSTSASGSFSGTGTCLNLNAGTTSAFTLNAGSFTVPLLQDAPGDAQAN